jgi:hypothetical protein
MMIIFDLVLGVGLFAVGRWGMRSMADLVPPELDAEGQEKKARVMRRGAWIVQIVGMLFFCLGAARIVLPLVGN